MLARRRLARAAVTMLTIGLATLVPEPLSPGADGTPGLRLQLNEGFDEPDGYRIPGDGPWHYQFAWSPAYVEDGVAHVPVGTQLFTTAFPAEVSHAWMMVARVRMPSTSHNHASFWVRADPFQWLTTTEHEIDVVESWGPSGNSGYAAADGGACRANSAYYWAHFPYQVNRRMRPPHACVDDVVADPWSGWHTYAVFFSSDDGEVRLTVDGADAGTLRRTSTEPGFPDMSVELGNKANGVDYNVQPNPAPATPPGSEMLVDWVQVYGE
jgi:hypothetical protein